MRKCPLCNKSASLKRGKHGTGEFYVVCGCAGSHMSYNNPIDLVLQWNQWVKKTREIKPFNYAL